jgi:hypothetical protein
VILLLCVCVYAANIHVDCACFPVSYYQANKLLVITQLLMGEIPERALFRQPDLSRSLRPYLALTQVLDACCMYVCFHRVASGVWWTCSLVKLSN